LLKVFLSQQKSSVSIPRFGTILFDALDRGWTHISPSMGDGIRVTGESPKQVTDIDIVDGHNWS
jgi:hypothetical protein